MRLTFRPLTPATWPHLEKLFGPRGACGGCWCMWWRRTRAEWTTGKGESNKRALKELVRQQDVPLGILAYGPDDEPVGWCAVAPREDYVTLARSRSLRRIDDQPVWSVTCLFVSKPLRRQGITTELLKAAVKFAGSHGALIVEGYPVEPKSGAMPDAFAWTGFRSAFERAGFAEAGRGSPTRPIMRAATRGRGGQTCAGTT